MNISRRRAARRDDGWRRPHRVRILALALIVIAASGACGSGGSHKGASKTPPTSAPSNSAPTSTIPPAQTVAGMHYVQLRTTVTPVVTAMRADLAKGKPIVESAGQLAVTESALQQFDTAVIASQATGTVKATVASLLSANQALLVDLHALHPGSPATTATRHALQTSLAAWTAASAAANTALSA